MANKDIELPPERALARSGFREVSRTGEHPVCRGCMRSSNPMDVNEVTEALAGIKATSEGVGSTLHNLISWFVPEPPGCNCVNRVYLMNAWGPDRCREELPTILAWLRESALDNGYRYSEFLVSSVVKLVIASHDKSEK